VFVDNQPINVENLTFVTIQQQKVLKKTNLNKKK
jgi:hypothetical protein